MPGFLLQLATDQQIEFLVGATELDVGLQRDRVVTLHERIEEFVDRDGLPALVTLVEIIALEHARDGVFGGQLDHGGSIHCAKPFRVEAQFGLLAIEHFVYLRRVGFRVREHVVARKRLARDVLATRVADHAGEIADQKNHLMAEILKLAHLVEQHRVTQVQVRRSRVETGFHTQRPAELEPRFQVFALDDFLSAASNLLQRCRIVLHEYPRGVRKERRFLYIYTDECRAEKRHLALIIRYSPTARKCLLRLALTPLG